MIAQSLSGSEARRSTFIVEICGEGRGGDGICCSIPEMYVTYDVQTLLSSVNLLKVKVTVCSENGQGRL